MDDEAGRAVYRHARPSLTFCSDAPTDAQTDAPTEALAAAWNQF